MPRINALAIVILSGTLVVAGGVSAAVAFSADSEPDVTIAPLTLEPQGSLSPTGEPSPSETSTPDATAPQVVQPSAPHDLGDDNGGDSSGHGGDDAPDIDDSVDDSGSNSGSNSGSGGNGSDDSN